MTKLRKFEKNVVTKNIMYENFIVSKGLISEFDSYVESKYAITSNGLEAKDQLFLFGEEN